MSGDGTSKPPRGDLCKCRRRSSPRHQRQYDASGQLQLASMTEGTARRRGRYLAAASGPGVAPCQARVGRCTEDRDVASMEDVETKAAYVLKD